MSHQAPAEMLMPPLTNCMQYSYVTQELLSCPQQLQQLEVLDPKLVHVMVEGAYFLSIGRASKLWRKYRWAYLMPY